MPPLIADLVERERVTLYLGHNSISINPIQLSFHFFLLFYYYQCLYYKTIPLKVNTIFLLFDKTPNHALSETLFVKLIIEIVNLIVSIQSSHPTKQYLASGQSQRINLSPPISVTH